MSESEQVRGREDSRCKRGLLLVSDVCDSGESGSLRLAAMLLGSGDDGQEEEAKLVWRRRAEGMDSRRAGKRT